ncbi:DNA-formamidopyrimidine glycosylase [Mycoplasma sp. U97]|uniref:DNA-formamidopyrimidine glycosylase n=1 Tax=Mycoplasma tauri TaxID=547987 RepID=A0A953NGX6_9MOLU|nr:DNA-formamidopyrimidine glycosylase [Mycoplasma tauri]MBZ4195476.1 DNA-formamidopyrimidine glycosylase [Mycoplasma tauri]MBZ4212477.1 DNA-formamidopyrimidine glycosylase [Mycoplasma tauri]
MPELPEVKTVINCLKPKVINKTIISVDVKLDKLLKNCTSIEFKNYLAGERILDIYNVGKNIIFKLTNEKNFISHLRMSGKYFTDKKIGINRQHDHIFFKLNDGICLFYNDTRQFGSFHIKNSNDLLTTEPLNKLGKHVEDINVSEVYQKMINKNIPIKNFLLDQSYILGIGNIYANEILFASKLNPWTKCKNIPFDKFLEIIKNTKDIFHKATILGGSSISDFVSSDNNEGQYQNYLNVHMRNKKSCHLCDYKIDAQVLSQRMTYYCPNCQKENYE